jgi:bifunctional DNA-binding transcriptional regulator/antitoxin component of YhaV-PrlF toxin-antitoxin module
MRADSVSMNSSTITDKGQTTVPLEIRKALGLRPRQKITWTIEHNNAVVRPQSSALQLFGVLKGKRRRDSSQQRTTTQRRVAKHAALEGTHGD